MIKKIYRIVKPSDLNTTYIGSTVDLIERLSRHKNDILTCLLDWIDNTCYLEELDQIEGEFRNDFETIEWFYIKIYRSLGYICLNYQDGRSKEVDYIKIRSAESNRIYKETGYTKTKRKERYEKDKSLGISQERKKLENALITKGFKNYQSKICKQAKKLGLTSKEYREKYNIPDYDGPKKIS